MKALKTLTILFALALGFVACEDDEPYTASKEIAPFVDRFFAEASERGVTISRSNFSVRALPQSSSNLVGGELTADGHKTFLYNPGIFTKSENQEMFAEIELEIYGVLKSLNVPGTTGDIDTTVDGFGEVNGSALTESQREMVFDQLF